MDPTVTVRPFTLDDEPEAGRAARAAHDELDERLGIPAPPPSGAQRSRELEAIRHVLVTDPGGCWLAEDAGMIAGITIALRREDVWILAELAVAPRHQGRGIGHKLLDAALAYADGTRCQLLTSSQDPRALRRYLRAGFALHPALGASGVVDRKAVVAGARVREGEARHIELAGELDRVQRGGAHGPDLDLMLRTGGRLLVTDDRDGRGYVLIEPGATLDTPSQDDAPWPTLLAATDRATATGLLWAALGESPSGATVALPTMTAAQQWALEVAVSAGLALEPIGPVALRGDPGPMSPYLPHSSFL